MRPSRILSRAPWLFIAVTAGPVSLAGQPSGSPPVVTPDGMTRTDLANQTGLTAPFTVQNQSSFQQTISLACSRTGQVSSCSVQGSVTIAGSGFANVSVTYSTAVTGTGTLTLTATLGA